MHTSFQLRSSDFSIKIDNTDASREDLLVDWHQYDRVGIIIDQPFGAIGATLLLQLCITAFYDFIPTRRSETLYPEVYLFHIGGPHGDHSSYDIYPPRKEVFLDNNPAKILEAINDRAITRLLVVDKDCKQVKHHYKEPSSAKDRISSVFAYSPTGRVPNPDVEIIGRNRSVLSNTLMALNPRGKGYTQSMEKLAKSARMPVISDHEIIPVYASRNEEIPFAVRDHIKQQFEQSSNDGVRRETFRRISLAESLNMLAL